MTRRTGIVLLLLLVAGLSVGGVAVVAVLTSPPPGVTVANYDRLRPGMSLDEATAILGPPDAGEPFDGPEGCYRSWTGKEVTISLAFSESGELTTGDKIFRST